MPRVNAMVKWYLFRNRATKLGPIKCKQSLPSNICSQVNTERYALGYRVIQMLVVYNIINTKFNYIDFSSKSFLHIS